MLATSIERLEADARRVQARTPPHKMFTPCGDGGEQTPYDRLISPTPFLTLLTHTFACCQALSGRRRPSTAPRATSITPPSSRILTHSHTRSPTHPPTPPPKHHSLSQTTHPTHAHHSGWGKCQLRVAPSRHIPFLCVIITREIVTELSESGCISTSLLAHVLIATHQYRYREWIKDNTSRDQNI